MKLILFFISSLFLTGCFFSSDKRPTQTQELKGEVFGSYFVVKYSGAYKKEDFEKKLSNFFSEFNQEFSTYQANSIVSKFNLLGPNEKIKVSSRFIQMLKLIKKLHEDTDGAFDPTFAPVIRLWGFGGGKKKNVPTEKDLKEAINKTGMEYIAFDEKQNLAWKTKQDISLDLNAFAPGWAADLIGLILEKNGVYNYMIDISGEIVTRGDKSEGSPWIIGIEKPTKNYAEAVQLALKISNLSISTSGNYRQFFDYHGKKMSHILDPKSGKPVDHSISSVTVIGKDGISTDAWSTALMVLGQKGIPLAEKMGLKVYFIESKSPSEVVEILSPSMQDYLNTHKL